MITGAAALGAGLWKRANKILSGIGKWLQEDHDWWRIGCLSLAAVCAYAAFAAYDAKKTIVIIKGTHSLAQTEWKAERMVLQNNEQNAKASLAQIAKTLEAKAQEIALIRQQNAHLMAENERLVAEADKGYAAYMKEYANRQPECTAALKVLAQTCPTLKGY